MDTNMLLIATVIIMVIAAAMTIIVGNSQGKKEGASTYFVNSGRKLGRLLAIYIIGIVIVIVGFLAYLNS